MKTYPIRREDGSLLAFEVTSAWVTFRPLFTILTSVPGVTNVKRQRFSEDHITFIYNGRKFIIWEPYGDNSRYWVGPEDTESERTDITALHEAFQNHHGFISSAIHRITERRAKGKAPGRTPNQAL